MSFEFQCSTREDFDKASAFCQEHNINVDVWGFDLTFKTAKDRDKVAAHVSGKILVNKVVSLMKDGRFLRTVRIESLDDPALDLASAIAAAGLEDTTGITLSR